MPDRPATGRGAKFWDRFADRYAARPIKDVAAYEALMTEAAAQLRSTDRVLEIGCGTGGTAIRLAPLVAQYIATDFSAQMIRIAAAKPAPPSLQFKVSDAETALEEGPFDVICAFNVLHLVDDLPSLLRGIHAQLRPGGLFLSKTWCFADLGRKLRLLFGGLRVFGLFPPSASFDQAHLRQALADAGFEIVDQRCFGSRPQNPHFVARKPIAPDSDSRPSPLTSRTPDDAPPR